MTEEVDDHARLALNESLRWLARELEQLAKKLRGERRRQVETLCSEARQMTEILGRVLRKSTAHAAAPRSNKPNEK